jgi:hypothetical protein
MPQKKVFINYSWQHHAKQAQKIYSMLSDTNQFQVWMDKHDLEGGLKWRPAIRSAIRNADYFISLLSKDSITGRGVRNTEIYEAIDVLREFPPTEIYMIPTRINECTPPFEEMLGLDWVDLFPNSKKGYDKLLKALGGSRPKKKLVKEGVEKASAKKYHYRVGIVDLDLGLPNLSEIAASLNAVQKYFLFTTPRMPVLKNTTETLGGIRNFAVHKVPDSYIAEHKHLGVDLITCITKYPLAFDEGDVVLYNYFAGESSKDERFRFLSADNLYEFCQKANSSFEEGIVSILTGQLVAYFTKAGHHKPTRGCVMDFCEDREDLVQSLTKRSICPHCMKKLPDGDLKDAILSLVSWKFS